MQKYKLIYPPSVNTYWRNVQGRTMISKRGRNYRDAVNALVNADPKKSGTLTGRLSVAIDVFPPDKRRRDIDNVLKATLDALDHAGVYQDDSQIDELMVQRCEVVQGGKLEISITEIKG